VTTAPVSRLELLEQQRAAAAWQDIDDLIKTEAKFRGKYGKLARSAGADIQMNGLGQTLAFWRAKGEEHHLALLKDVSDWVIHALALQTGNLIDWVIHTATTDQYRRATAEAIAYLIWVKRFAEAEFGDSE